MPQVRIIPPAFKGDVWFVEINYGVYSSPYSRCNNKQEAKDKAAEAKDWLKDMA